MIKIQNLHKTYNLGSPNQYHALRGINLTIESGEFISIEGKSGAGKSTLLHIIGCLDKPTEGKILLSDIDISKLNDKKLAQIRNNKIGFVLQDFALLQEKKAWENVALPLYFDNTKLSQIKSKSLSALEMVGMIEFSDRKINQLSGGQKQRVAIARAIVNNPDIILADEPTGALDSKTTVELMELIKLMNSSGKTIVIVTHDKDVSSYTKRKIIIRDGNVWEE